MLPPSASAPTQTPSAPPHVVQHLTASLFGAAKPRTAGVAGDRAYRVIGGTWSCVSGAGATSTHRYTLEPNGSIRMHNEMLIAKKPFAIDEYYSYDPTTQRWKTETQGNAYIGFAPPSTGATWAFTGVVPHGTEQTLVRLTYRWLGSGAFSRTFERFKDGEWNVFAAETCRRR